MKIGYTVGEIEQHQMELSYDQSSGYLLVMMDGAQVLQDEAHLNSQPTKRYEISVGNAERHRLALQLSYGQEQDDTSYGVGPRLSLHLTPVAS